MVHTLNLSALRPKPLELLRRAWAANRPLTLVGLLFLLTFVGTLVGIALDPRVITGAPAWVKPSKFAISVVIYSFTFLWLLTFVRGWPRLVQLASWVTVVTLIVEMAIIVFQAARGTTSHFNVSTPLNAALWSTMAIAIVLLWLAALLLSVLLLLQRLPNPILAWGLRLGVLVALIGMALAFLMPQPTPAQAEAMAAGRAPSAIGAHSVGVEDGGPGLPYLGWSTEGGDLRIAHFVGLHAMQALPLLAWLVGLYGAGRLSLRRQVALVVNGGLTYLGLTLLLAWQALRGQPLIAPDALTLGALAALLVAATVAAALALFGGKPQLSEV